MPQNASDAYRDRVLRELQEALARNKPQSELDQWREATMVPDMTVQEMEALKSLGRFSWRDYPVDAVLDAYRKGYADGVVAGASRG